MGNLARFALTIGAAAFFAGCGGSQQIGSPLPGGAMSPLAPFPLPRFPQSSQPLLYVANDYPSSIDIFPLTGPNQPQIGSITNGVEYEQINAGFNGIAVTQ